MINRLKYCLIAAVVVLSTLGELAMAQSLNSIAAIVNKEIITSAQVQKGIENTKRGLTANNIPVPPPAKLRKMVLDRLINDALQLQLAKRAKMEVSNEELNGAITKIAKRNNLTVSELKRKIESSGLDYKTYRKRIQKQMLITKVQQQAVSHKVKMTPQEVDAFIKKNKSKLEGARGYHLETVLIPVPSGASEQKINAARTHAYQIASQLKKGTSIKSIIKNQVFVNQIKAIDLGWRPSNDLPSIFAKHVKGNEKKGDIIGPIKADNGYHVVKVLGVQDGGQSLTKEKARAFLFEQKFTEQFKKWIRKLREQSYIKIMKS